MARVHRAGGHRPSASSQILRTLIMVSRRSTRHSAAASSSVPAACTSPQGHTLAHSSAQLQDLQDTSLTFELNLSTIGPHPWVNLDCMTDKVSLS